MAWLLRKEQVVPFAEMLVVVVRIWQVADHGRMVAVSRDQGQIHCDVLSAMFVYKVPLCGTAALTDFIVSPRTELLDMTMFVLKTLTIHNFTTLTGP